MSISHTLFASLLLATLAIGVAAQSPSKLDDRIRADFGAGMKGDTAAFDRAMAACEEVLAREPKNAHALVWHGLGVLSRAGKAFQTGDVARGGEMWGRGLAEMEEAVAIAPDDLDVRMTRGQTLLEASRYVPDPGHARELLEKGVGDLEHALSLVEKRDDAPPALVTRLRSGLADGYTRLGNAEKASAYRNQ